MNTDSYFEIGYSHTVCEDYAIAGKLNEHLSYAIVCDGCSSSKGVDIGARILAHAALQTISTIFGKRDCLDITSDIDNPQIAHRTSALADAIRKQMGLPLDALDSTAIIVVASQQGFKIFSYGDGCVAFKFRSGDKQSYSIEFDSGAPYYLSYLLDGERNKKYEDLFGTYPLRVRGDMKIPSTDDFYNESYRFSGTRTYEYISFGVSDIEWVSIMSDGATSYQRKTQEEEKPVQLEDIDWKDSVGELTAYKNFKGEFVKRKMNKLKKTHVKSNVVHYDDVSIASIYIG